MSHLNFFFKCHDFPLNLAGVLYIQQYSHPFIFMIKILPFYLAMRLLGDNISKILQSPLTYRESQEDSREEQDRNISPPKSEVQAWHSVTSAPLQRSKQSQASPYPVEGKQILPLIERLSQN